MFSTCEWIKYGYCDLFWVWNVVGGYFTSQIVSKYSKNGWQEDLPKLKVGRRGHGCSAYTRNDKMVRTELMLTKQEISILF